MGKILAASGLAALLAIPVVAHAQIYRSVDENGNVVFSDQPPPPGTKAETVELGELNTASPPPPRARSAPAPEPEAEATVPDPTVSITAPADETTIPMGPGNFSVNGSVEPPLASGEQLQLFMDGDPVSEPQTASTWALTGVLRGPHDLVIRRIGRGGDVVAESGSVRVFVLRPSIR